MIPFFLLNVTHLHSRAGITRYSHFRLNPFGLSAVFRKLFASQHPARNCH